ncbi:hypothetical protein IJI31_04130 [bacterium]|nr:hypothetical protein [bacterium]
MLKLKVLSTQNVFILPNDTANELLSLYPDDYELLEGTGVNKKNEVRAGKKKVKGNLLKNSVITENLPKISSSILHLILDI